MSKVTESVYFIQGQDDFIPDSHSYVLGKPSSQDLSLIDPGLVGKSAHKIRSIQKDMGIDLEAVKRIIMTHTHLDHIGCLPEILQEIPWAEVWVHTLEAQALEHGDERTVYGMDMLRGMCQVQYGLKPGMFTLNVHRHLKGGEEVDLGGMTWEIMHIPGHSMGSIALYNRSARILISGDVVYADCAIGRFDLHGADRSELRSSLMRLAELEVHTLLPGHNRIVTDLSPDYILETAKQWEPYLI